MAIGNGFAVPAPLRESAVSVFGQEGANWVARLPDQVASYMDLWDLDIDLPAGGDPWHGFCGIVVPVRGSGGDPAVLKISYPDEDNAHEHLALFSWAGGGAVRLLAVDVPNRAMLLERLDGDRDLSSVPVDEAIPVLVALLWRLAIPASEVIGTLAERATRWLDDLPGRWRKADLPWPRWMLDRAMEAARDLGPGSGGLLIHTDLHYENVLASLPANQAERGEWLAIDPKPIAGDLEFGILPLLWNRLDELDGSDPASDLNRRMHLAAEAGGLDVGMVREWSIARLVETMIWNYEAGVVETGHGPGWIVEALAGNR